jgi:flagellar hook protein FlgE
MGPALSGLKTFEKKMRVTANNVANVNTNGFKASRTTSQDVLSETVTTAVGPSQVGRGAAVSDISSSFSQGSFESTDSPTDLAIGGKGFFVVRDPDNPENTVYTRSGNFRFDEAGNLTTPSGHVARGWPVDTNGQPTGSIGDIVLSSLASTPSQTTSATIVTNLDSRANSHSNTLELAWDGDNPVGTYMATGSYEHQMTFVATDSLGNTHDITVYFDATGSMNTWEFIAATDPSEDMRSTASGDGMGLLARGTVTFNTTGTITNMTLSAYNGAASVSTPSNWTPVSSNSAGYLTISPTFVSGTSMNVALDFGTRFNATTAVWEPDSLSTTQYAQASTTVFQSTDGYSAGALQSISVDTDGMITGRYTNGEVIPLFQLALADFQNPQGLRNEGGGLFMETRQSGAPMTGSAGTQGLGSIAPNSLELSNVDIATEMVKTMTNQRGYEANLQIIKATDEMWESVIDLFA